MYKVENWLNKETGPLVISAIRQQVDSEKQERLIKAPNSAIDYGYSFPALNHLKQACLEEVRGFFETNGERPMIADIGAGFGLMTWKLIAAGGRVDAYELQEPTAEELKKRLEAMNPEFWERERLDRLLQVLVGDAITHLGVAKNKYDYIWIGQVIHFLNPTDLKKLSIILQDSLKPGGKLFLEANTLDTFKALPGFSLLQKACERNKGRPPEARGFIASDAVTLIDKTEKRVVAFLNLSALSLDDMENLKMPLQVQAYGAGLFGGQSLSEETKLDLCLSNPSVKDHVVVFNCFHQVMNLLNLDDLTELFSPGALCPVDLFYSCTDHSRFMKPHSEAPPSSMCGVFQKQAKLSFEPYRFHQPAQEDDAHMQLKFRAESLCRYKPAHAAFVDAVNKKEYALALRRACHVGAIALVHLIIRFKDVLEIDINQSSASQKQTALDIILKAQDLPEVVQRNIFNELIAAGAKTFVDSVSSCEASHVP